MNKNKYFFELSKEHNDFAVEEIKKVLLSENIDFKVLELNDDVLLIESGFLPNQFLSIFSTRISQTFNINSFLFSSKPQKNILLDKAELFPVSEKGSIAIRYRNRSDKVDSRSIVKSLADVYTKNRDVDLDKPDVEVRALITDKQVFVGVKKAEINRSEFERRKVQNRPFFSPITLHPRLARGLVNLSGVKKDDFLFDPFCGTGGFLIEAGLMGIKITGSDVEEKMITGCKKTLEFFKINDYTLFVSDVGDIDKHVELVDAVVTDMPYGKATTTKGEEPLVLYKRAFEKISNVLKDEGTAVVGIPDEKVIDFGKKYMKHVKTFSFRVHKSLTRYFPVFQKQP